MLGKLFKYDMRANAKLLLPAALFVLATTLLGTIALRISNQGITLFRAGTAAADIFSVLMGLIFFVSVFALIIYTAASFILILIHYYRNLFSAEGYLTFTLPVSTSDILTSKMLAASIWLMLSSLVTTLCVLLYITFGGAPAGELVYTEFYEELGAGFAEMFEMFSVVDGMFILIELTVLVLSSTLMGVLQAFLAITIGAIMAKKHKIVAAIVAYYIINMIVSIVSTVIMMILLFNSAFLYEMMTYDLLYGEGALNEWSIMHMIFVIYILAIVIIGVAEYLVNNRMLKKKLNI